MMTITEPARALCAGKWQIFDATDEASHAEARAICQQCPLLSQCAITASTLDHKEGTWAARLHSGARGRPSTEAEDALYTEDEARLCYNAWQRGEHDYYNKVGRRVYKRRRAMAAKDRAEAAGVARQTLTERRIADEEAMFTDDEARAGASAYRMGDRTERNRLAARVYHRRNRNARRMQSAA